MPKTGILFLDSVRKQYLIQSGESTIEAYAVRSKPVCFNANEGNRDQS